MEEVWKPIEGFPSYEVSNFGRINNIRRKRELNPGIDGSNGYKTVNLYDETGRIHKKYMHRLVAEAFIPNPENKRTVNHIDCDKTNNRIDNLEWATDSENMRHAFNNNPCENTREAARENIIKTNKRPKTKKQLETSSKNINSPICRARAVEAHVNKHPMIKIVETGEMFRSQKEVAFRLGANQSAVCACLNDRRNHVKGYHLKYVTDQSETATSFLYPYQMDAVKKLKNGSILNGGVGSGKSRTALYYYFSQQGGSINGVYTPAKEPKNLLILTTAQKRDSLEWSSELCYFLMSTNSECNYYDNKIIVDSWNNIKKYEDLSGWFVLYDEQRVCGSGAWVRSFLKMTKNNDWILLSATPGDNYLDYVPLFIANGFFKNRTEFTRNHVVYSRFTKYPKVDHYYNTGKLERYRRQILVDMDFKRETTSHHEDIYCDYDVQKYKDVGRNRWDPFKDEPIVNASGLCYIWRRIVNTDTSRQHMLLELVEKHPKIIVFYNFNHELDILKKLDYGKDVKIAEYNGHKHEPIPDSDSWVYLVNYNAGNSGWNCVKTDTIVFYSQNYSYKVMEQAAGRIDRLNTPYTDLYYYHLKSRSGIDLAISKALKQKKNFNEGRFVSGTR